MTVLHVLHRLRVASADLPTIPMPAPRADMMQDRDIQHAGTQAHERVSVRKQVASGSAAEANTVNDSCNTAVAAAASNALMQHTRSVLNTSWYIVRTRMEQQCRANGLQLRTRRQLHADALQWPSLLCYYNCVQLYA